MRTIFKLLRPEVITKKVQELSEKFKKFETPVSRKILSHIVPIPEENLRVFLYRGMIHAKAILIDDYVAILGSANLTYGSFDLLNETNAIFRQND
jgi:phosphatidylserine/phosphatidylglycerophosphate/cardiolipin synthase-like enzyme